jgi:hypothetical protein
MYKTLGDLKPTVYMQNFGKNKLNSNLNKYESKTSPGYWGPRLWNFLHTSSLAYPVNPSIDVQNKMLTFVNNLPVSLPCMSCQQHAAKYISQHENQLKEAVKSREKLFKFFVDFHNSVNKRTNKPTYTYEEALHFYI